MEGEGKEGGDGRREKRVGREGDNSLTTLSISFFKMVGFNLTAATATMHCLKLCCFIMQFDTVIHAQQAATWSKTSL